MATADIALSMAGSLYKTFKYLAAGAIVIGFLIWMIQRAKYNKIVIVKSETGTHNRVFQCKAKNLKDPDGTQWWFISGGMFSNIKFKATVPPKEAIDLMNGKEFAVCTLTTNRDVIWQIKDPSQTGKGLTPEEKVILAHQFFKAAEWKKKSGMETLLQLAPMIFVIILLTMLFVFWGHIVEPAKQLSANIVAHDTLVKETLLIIQDIKEGNVRIESELKQGIIQGGIEPVPAPPN